MQSEEFVALLDRLDIRRRHLPCFIAEGVCSEDDLRGLSAHDCRALGLSIGERNRLLDWATEGASQQVGPRDEDLIATAIEDYLVRLRHLTYTA